MAEYIDVAFVDNNGKVTVEDVLVPDDEIGIFRFFNFEFPRPDKLQHFLVQIATPSCDERHWLLHIPMDYMKDYLQEGEDRMLGVVRVIVFPIKFISTD